jgi:hypothetical protein
MSHGTNTFVGLVGWLLGLDEPADGTPSMPMQLLLSWLRMRGRISDSQSCASRMEHNQAQTVIVIEPVMSSKSPFLLGTGGKTCKVQNFVDN